MWTEGGLQRLCRCGACRRSGRWAKALEEGIPGRHHPCFPEPRDGQVGSGSAPGPPRPLPAVGMAAAGEGLCTITGPRFFLGNLVPAGPSRLKHRAPCSLTSEFLPRGFCPEAPLLRLQACEGCLWDARAGLEKGHQGSRCFWKSFGLCRVPVLRVHVSSFCSQGGHSGLKGRWEPVSVS